MIDEFIPQAQARLSDLLEEDRQMSAQVKSLAELQKANDFAQRPELEAENYLKSLEEVVKRSSHVR